MMKGCLVVHGLTGSPETVAPLAEALLAQGYRVSSPWLAGHQGTLEDLGKSTWQEWVETVRVAFQTLRREVDQVYYAGLSLGALLGLKLAIDEGWGVKGLALLSTPLTLDRWSNVLIPLVRATPLRYVITSTAKNWERSVGDEEGRQRYQQCSFSRFPAGAAIQLAELQKVLRKDLRRIQNPLLLVHATQDCVAPYRNVGLIKKLVGSQMIETVTLAHSQHVVTMDAEKDIVSKKVIDFFHRLEPTR